MQTLKSHRDLTVWQKAMELAVMVYQVASVFPSSEMYGLTAQMKRAVCSVPANIAEGYARATTKDYAHFLSIAKGSLMETETFLLLAVKLRYITDCEAQPVYEMIQEISKMLTVMRHKLTNST